MDPNSENQLQSRQSPQQQQQPRPSAANAEDEDEPTGSGSVLFDAVHQMMEKFSATRIGQYVLRCGDRVLGTIEDTVKWSLPQDKASLPLARPLPWLPFLMLIIFLRLVRFWLSMVALFIGNGPVTPKVLIYFIQTRRRKLRSIRINGMKVIQQEAADKDKDWKTEYVNKLLMNLCKLFAITRCSPQVSCETASNVSSEENLTTRGSDRPLKPVSHQYRREHEPDDRLTEFMTMKLLERFAPLASEDDSEYNPMINDYIETSNDDSNLSAYNASNTQSEYGANTSGENINDLSKDECEETDETKYLSNNERMKEENAPNEANEKKTEETEKDKSPQLAGEGKLKEEKIIPRFEITGTEEKSKSPIKPNKKEEIFSEEIIPASPASPLANDQIEGGDEVDEWEALIDKSLTPKSEKDKLFNYLNGHKNEQNKATPGHESAADTKPHIPPSLLSNTSPSKSSSTSSSSTSNKVLVNASSPDFSSFHKPPSPQQKRTTVIVEKPKNSSVHTDVGNNGGDEHGQHSQHGKLQRTQPERQARGEHQQDQHQQHQQQEQQEQQQTPQQPQQQQQQHSVKRNSHQRYRRNRR